ncbi:MAG: ATP-binding protein [Desulfobulbaceae bacterium]|nr:ATP-binding protein [Desulfobulbaceae bacterium]
MFIFIVKYTVPRTTVPRTIKPLRSPLDEDLHDLIAERHEQTATIVTSNLDFSEWGEAFPNRLLGAATIDRLKHNAYCLVLEGKSYRSPKISPTGKKNKEEKL